MPYLGIYYYAINSKKITDIRVRKALSLAVNRDVITQKLLREGQVSAYTLVPDGINNYDTNRPKLPFAKTPYKKALAQAKALMKEAGYSKDNPYKIELKYNTNESHKKVAVAISAMWRQINVKTTLFNQEAKVHYANLKDGDFKVGRAGWIGDYNDPTTFTDLFLDNPYNYPRWIDKDLIANSIKASKLVDLKKRADLLAKAEKAGLESYTILPIYYYVSRHIVSKKVIGWENNILDHHHSRWIDLKE